MAGPQIALYVSSVEGQHVTRFGTRTLIGAEIDKSVEGLLVWDTEKVVAISVPEYTQYQREYDRLIEDKALVKRTAEDFVAANAARDAAVETAAAEVKAKAEAAAAPAVPAADPPATEVVTAPKKSRAPKPPEGEGK